MMKSSFWSGFTALISGFNVITFSVMAIMDAMPWSGVAGWLVGCVGYSYIWYLESRNRIKSPDEMAVEE